MKVHIPLKIYQKLRAYTKGTEYEISGLGKISFFNNVFTIEDIKIFEQTVTSAETTLDRRALGKFYDKIIKKEGSLSDWSLWWHSHSTMSTFFSAVDEATIEDFDNETSQDNWLLSLVTNIKGDIRIRLDIFSPIRLTIDNIEYKILYDNEEIEDEIKKEIDRKVKEPRSFWSNLRDNNRDDYNEDDDLDDIDDQFKKYKRKKNKKSKTTDLPPEKNNLFNKDIDITVNLDKKDNKGDLLNKIIDFFLGK